MADLDILSEMIRDSARVTPKRQHDRLTVTLSEPACPDCEVSIRGLPENSIVIKADVCFAPDTIFKGAKGECCRADYVIVAEKNGQIVVIYIELKKGNSSKHWEIENQLKGANCFVDYCKAIGREFWLEKNFLSSAKHRFVSFCHKVSICKNPCYESGPGSLHDRADNFLRLYGGRPAEFNRLAALG